MSNVPRKRGPTSRWSSTHDLSRHFFVDVYQLVGGTPDVLRVPSALLVPTTRKLNSFFSVSSLNDVCFDIVFIFTTFVRRPVKCIVHINIYIIYNMEVKRIQN